MSGEEKEREREKQKRAESFALVSALLLGWFGAGYFFLRYLAYGMAIRGGITAENQGVDRVLLPPGPPNL